jgi:hypothetical protein
VKLHREVVLNVPVSVTAEGVEAEAVTEEVKVETTEETTEA